MVDASFSSMHPPQMAAEPANPAMPGSTRLAGPQAYTTSTNVRPFLSARLPSRTGSNPILQIPSCRFPGSFEGSPCRRRPPSRFPCQEIKPTSGASGVFQEFGKCLGSIERFAREQAQALLDHLRHGRMGKHGAQGIHGILVLVDQQGDRHDRARYLRPGRAHAQNLLRVIIADNDLGETACGTHGDCSRQ